MQQMLNVCEDFASCYNIFFSTDPNPSKCKCKSKCIFMMGRVTNLAKPVPLTLCGLDLPWVESATRLLGTAPELQGSTWYKMYWDVDTLHQCQARHFGQVWQVFQRTSPCWKVTVLANLVARDVRPSSGRNIKYGGSSGIDPWNSGILALLVLGLELRRLRKLK